jgi:hypothetical protein
MVYVAQDAIAVALKNGLIMLFIVDETGDLL